MKKLFETGGKRVVKGIKEVRNKLQKNAKNQIARTKQISNFEIESFL